MNVLTVKALFSGDRFTVDDTPFPREIFVKIFHPEQQGMSVGLKSGDVKNWCGGTIVTLCNTIEGCNLEELDKS